MNKEKLDLMINWYINECDKNDIESWIKDREEKEEYAKSIDKNKMLSFTESDVIDYLGHLWCYRIEFRKKHTISENGLENFKMRLADLLYGERNLDIRWDEFNNNIKVFKSAAMSEALSCLYPDKYMIWNNTTKSVFKYLGLVELAKKNNLTFSEYNEVLNVCKVIQNELVEKSGKYQSLLDVDNMFYHYNEAVIDNIDNDGSVPDINEPISPDLINQPYTWEDMDKDVFLSKNQYDEIVRLINDKKNIIIEGAPGVGKTYIVKKLVYSMMEEIDESRIEFVQFHQSYSYEDFVRGYRPTNDGGYELKDGIFLKFCEKARKDKRPHYLIIDEINRGNISKIFGELLMLIEKDKRDKYFLKLAYQKDENEELFTVPENLYIIGLMNTADRSLALMDYALRRRFAFYHIDPLFENDNPKFNEYMKKLPNNFRKLIEAVIKLNEKIASDDSLGEGFKIGHSYFSNLEDYEGNFDQKLKDIVNYEIKPMLSEYWYDDSKKVKDETNKLIEAINDKN